MNELFRGNSIIISDCRVSTFLKTLPGCQASRHNGGKNKVEGDARHENKVEGNIRHENELEGDLGPVQTPNFS